MRSLVASLPQAVAEVYLATLRLSKLIRRSLRNGSYLKNPSGRQKVLRGYLNWGAESAEKVPENLLGEQKLRGYLGFFTYPLDTFCA